MKEVNIEIQAPDGSTFVAKRAYPVTTRIGQLIEDFRALPRLNQQEVRSKTFVLQRVGTDTLLESTHTLSQAGILKDDILQIKEAVVVELVDAPEPGPEPTPEPVPPPILPSPSVPPMPTHVKPARKFNGRAITITLMMVVIVMTSLVGVAIAWKGKPKAVQLTIQCPPMVTTNNYTLTPQCNIEQREGHLSLLVRRNDGAESPPINLVNVRLTLNDESIPLASEAWREVPVAQSLLLVLDTRQEMVAMKNPLLEVYHSNKLFVAKRALQQLIAFAPPTTKFGLVTTAATINPTTDRQQLQRAIDAVHPAQDKANLLDTLAATLQEATKQNLHDVVIISDGIVPAARAATKLADSTEDRWQQLAATARKEGIRLFAIAVGTHNPAFPELRVNSDALDMLAGKSILLDVIALERQARQDDVKYQRLVAEQLQPLVEHLNAQPRRAYVLMLTLPKMKELHQMQAGQLILTLESEELRVPFTITAIPAT